MYAPIVPSKSNATNLIILGFLIYFTHDSARIPNCHTIGWNITSNNAARPNHTACSNFNPRENDDAPSNPASISNFNRKRINPAKMGVKRSSNSTGCVAV